LFTIHAHAPFHPWIAEEVAGNNQVDVTAIREVLPDFTASAAARWQLARKLSRDCRYVTELARGPPLRRWKHECRNQDVQQPSSFDTANTPRFDADKERARTHFAPYDGNSAAVGSAKPQFRRKRTLVVSISLVGLFAAGWLIRDSALYERTDEAQVDGRILPLSARINGQVQQVNVVDGQLVNAGDELATMDQGAYKIKLLEALANLAYAQNTAASLYFKAAITVTAAYGGLSAAQVAAKNASLELQNAEYKLRADEAALKQAQVDGPVADAVAAADQQALLQAQDKLVEAITNLRTAQTAPQQADLANVEAQAADSQVLQRKAELEQAQRNLSDTILRSPVTGIVGRRRLEPGQSISIGQDLIDIVSLDDVWITAKFKQTQLARLRPGQPVEVQIGAYGRTWRGHVTNLGGGAGSAFSAMPETSAGNHVRTAERVPVRIDFDRREGQDFNTEGMLKPGLSAKSEVRVRSVPQVRAPDRLPTGRGPTPGPAAL
jgi:membrane fusion protein (multidrug efflux system)